MSESVACVLEYMGNEKTKQTRLFIRMIDHFFDYMNVKSPLLSQLKRKDSIAPYHSPSDYRFKAMHTRTCTRTHNTHTQWLSDFLGYLAEWEQVKSQPGIDSRNRQCG